MTPVTRLEEWIAPRALKLLAMIGVLVVSLGLLAAYFVRQHDLQRVERLERTIRCQDNRECREFVKRAIREILREQRAEGKAKPGLRLRLEPSRDQRGSEVVIEGPQSTPSPTSMEQPEPPQGQGGSKPTQSEQGPPAPSQPPSGQTEPVQPSPPGPKGNPPLPIQLPPPAEEAAQSVKELPCAVLRDVHGLC